MLVRLDPYVKKALQDSLAKYCKEIHAVIESIRIDQEQTRELLKKNRTLSRSDNPFEEKLDPPPPYPEEAHASANNDKAASKMQPDNNGQIQVHSVSFLRSKPFKEHLLSSRVTMATLEKHTAGMMSIFGILLENALEQSDPLNDLNANVLMEQFIGIFSFLESKSREIAHCDDTEAHCKLS